MQRSSPWVAAASTLTQLPMPWLEAFAVDLGPSSKAFFVVPLVGALFLDFANASLITLFMKVLA